MAFRCTRIAAVGMMLALTACGGGVASDTTTPPGINIATGSDGAEATGGLSAPVATSTTRSLSDGIDVASPPDVLVGTWNVGDAGAVTFDVVDRRLHLVDHFTAEGWESVVQEQSRDELEVRFTRGGVSYFFEAEIDDDQLEVEIDQDIRPAEPGRYEIGTAGTIEFSVEGKKLTLIDATARSGWTVSVLERDDEIEIDFVRGMEQWDIDIDFDDDDLDMDIDYTAEGPLS